jgi:hypothetical protein
LVRIGVLAYRGKDQAMKMWSPTALYFTRRIPGHTFTIVPLDFHEMGPADGSGGIDFVVTNTSFYVELESQYGVSRIATLKNKRDSNTLTVFGGVIFCRDDRQDIRDLRDLKGKTFMAVEETSLGGWQAAWREFKAAGIAPYRDFNKLEFAKTHDAVVYAIPLDYQPVHDLMKELRMGPYRDYGKITLSGVAGVLALDRSLRTGAALSHTDSRVCHQVEPQAFYGPVETADVPGRSGSDCPGADRTAPGNERRTRTGDCGSDAYRGGKKQTSETAFPCPENGGHRRPSRWHCTRFQ